MPRLRSTRLGHVGPAAAAFATERLGAQSRQRDGVEPGGQVGGNADDDRRLALGARYDGDDPGADPPLQIVRQRAQLATRHVLDQPAVKCNIANPLAGRSRVAATSAGQRPARFGQLALEPAIVVEQPRQAGRQLGRAGAQRHRRLPQQLLFLGKIGLGRGAGQRFDTADARGHRAFADDLEQADIAGAADMGAAAQLDRIGSRIAVGRAVCAAHRHDTDLLAVFLAEQRERALGDCPLGAQ